MEYYQALVCKTKTGRRFFTYETDEKLKNGQIVVVNFGRRQLPAIIISVVKKPAFATKKILSVTSFALPAEHTGLLNWLLSFYPDDYGLIGSTFLPANLNLKARQTPPNILKGDNKPLPPPTKDQAAALKLIDESDKVILQGITGSGKTRVFTEEIKKTLRLGKSVLIITPEIGLTPQLIDDVKQYVADPLLVNHSMLTPAEKRRVWQYANDNGKPTVYIGPRSSLFIPIKNIGLIVVDEFHDQSLKQQNSPRYNALHVSSQLAKIHQAKIIFSSATPAVSDLYQMEKAGYKVARLNTLAVSQLPASGEIIDSTDRTLFTKNNYLSNAAIEAITNCLARNEQALLFINRRGSARLVKCASCGWQAICDKCGLPMTYHHDVFSLFCHSCATKKPAPKSCPDCGSLEISFKIIGTKSLADNVQKLFPKARLRRFDADSNASDKLHRNIENLKTGQTDIIIGTQILSKGIDLPNLSLVVVVNADSGLALPDFSAEEHLFQQLYQVTGRVGRGHRKSHYILQTQNPAHPVLEAVLKRDYDGFYSYEINKRRQFKYPPFCFMGAIKITKKTFVGAQQKAQAIADSLRGRSLQVLGPSPSFYEKNSAGYNWQIILKASKRSAILKELAQINDATVDIDPNSLL